MKEQKARTEQEAQEKGSWLLESGLPDDFDFHITGASFGYRQEYMNGEALLLIWEGESPDDDVESIIWPCGGKWEVGKGGAEAAHPKRVRFVKTSMMGKLIDRVVNKLGVDMQSRGESFEAKVWVGLGFHMKREEIEYGGILEDRGGKTVHLMPVGVLEAKAGKGATNTDKSKGTAAVVEDKPVTKVIEKKLSLLAKKLSKEEFQSKAMDMAEVVDDADLLAAVLEDSDDGFWAKAQE